jgi:hypothetical protein
MLPYFHRYLHMRRRTPRFFSLFFRTREQPLTLLVLHITKIQFP